MPRVGTEPCPLPMSRMRAARSATDSICAVAPATEPTSIRWAAAPVGAAGDDGGHRGGCWLAPEVVDHRVGFGRGLPEPPGGHAGVLVEQDGAGGAERGQAGEPARVAPDGRTSRPDQPHPGRASPGEHAHGEIGDRLAPMMCNLSPGASACFSRRCSTEQAARKWPLPQRGPRPAQIEENLRRRQGKYRILTFLCLEIPLPPRRVHSGVSASCGFRLRPDWRVAAAMACRRGRQCSMLPGISRLCAFAGRLTDGSAHYPNGPPWCSHHPGARGIAPSLAWCTGSASAGRWAAISAAPGRFGTPATALPARHYEREGGQCSP